MSGALTRNMCCSISNDVAAQVHWRGRWCLSGLLRSLCVSFGLLLTTLYFNTKKGDYQNPLRRYPERKRSKWEAHFPVFCWSAGNSCSGALGQVMGDSPSSAS